MEVADSELKPLYQWVDEIPLSRPKRNIARDFADGVLVAEVIAHFYPRLIELHNYSSANAMTQKMYNWQTLNQRALRKLGFQIPLQDVQDCCNNKAGAIERVLKLCKYKMAEFQSKHGVKGPGPDAGAKKTDKTSAANAVSPGVLKPQKTNAQPGGYAPAPVKEGMVPIVFQSAEPAEMTREEKMKAYARAQDKGIKGFAEADPTFDVEGIDAAHKLAIIGAIAFGIPLSFDKIFTQGIRDIDSVDIEYCAELGYRIKHLGIARRQDTGVELRVHPTLVSQKALLANVEGEKNAIMVHGDAVGPTVYYGAGAGAGPTASSVVADLIDTVRIMSVDPSGRVPHLAFQPDQITDEPVLASEDFVCGHYFRVQVADQIGVMAEITRALAEQQIGIEAILQKDPPTAEDDARVMIVTKPARERSLMQVLDHIRALPYTRDGVVHMRVAQFED